MLKKLKAKNFKCWEDLEIDFSDKITAITGESTHGKTSIINAIKLISTLRPNGSNYISGFAKNKKTNISIEFQNGSVDFEKTKAKAQYVLNEDKENPFSQLNKNVPEEINDFIKIDDDNFSWQFEGPYLIFSPNSVISKKINESIGIERWDSKLKEINKELNQTKREVKEKYKKFKDKKRLLKKIDELGYPSLKGLISEKEDLEKNLFLDIEKYERIKEYSRMLRNSNLTEINEKINECSSTIKHVELIKEKINKNKEAYQSLKTLKKIKESSTVFDKIDTMSNLLNKITSKIDLLKISINNDKESVELINRRISINKKIKEADLSISKLIKSINKIEVCPECGQNIDKI